MLLCSRERDVRIDNSRPIGRHRNRYRLSDSSPRSGNERHSILEVDLHHDDRMMTISV